MANQASIEIHTQLLAGLLPEGLAWPRDPDSAFMALVEGLAVEFADIEEKADTLPVVADPRVTIDLILDFEKSLNLPDDCAVSSDTIQERRTALMARYLSKGGQTKGFFEALAQDYGYHVEIEEFRPFRVGMSSVIDPLYDHGDAIRHRWRVTVAGDRETYFRCGQSSVIEPLYKLTRAEDLECIFHKLKPAHTHLIFQYQEGN